MGEFDPFNNKLINKNSINDKKIEKISPVLKEYDDRAFKKEVETPYNKSEIINASTPRRHIPNATKELLANVISACSELESTNPSGRKLSLEDIVKLTELLCEEIELKTTSNPKEEKENRNEISNSDDEDEDTTPPVPEVKAGDSFMLTMSGEKYECIAIPNEVHVGMIRFIRTGLDKTSNEHMPVIQVVGGNTLAGIEPIVNLHYANIKELTEMLLSFQKVKILGTAVEQYNESTMTKASHLFIEANSKIIHIMAPIMLHVGDTIPYFYVSNITAEEFEKIKSLDKLKFTPLVRTVHPKRISWADMFDFYHKDFESAPLRINGIDMQYVIIYDFEKGPMDRASTAEVIRKYSNGIKNILEN